MKPRVLPASNSSLRCTRLATTCRLRKAAAACPEGKSRQSGSRAALIRKPQILFLDEPTAHFDTRSEAEFLERLKVLAHGDMTIIVSTHRLSLLALVDRLLVFEQGQLIADGPTGSDSRQAPGARARGRPSNRKHRRKKMQQSDFAFVNDIRAASELAHATSHRGFSWRRSLRC